MNPLKKDTYHISANKLNIGNQCPFKLYLYLARHKTGDKDLKYINAGLAVHDYMDDLLKGKAMTPFDYVAKRRVPDDTLERAMKSMENGFNFLVNEDGTVKKGKGEETIKKKFTTPKGRKVIFEARIDLIDEDEGFIVDYKTGKTINKPEYILQMHGYRFVKDYALPAKIISLLTNKEIIIEETPLNFIEDECDKYIDMIENRDFPKKPHYLCRYCEYYNDFCSKDAEFKQIETIIPMAEKKEGTPIEDVEVLK